MKLVYILARELKEWPEDCEAIAQDRFSSRLFKVNGPAISTCVEAMAEDANTAKVTRAQWQAAVDALNTGEIAYSTEDVSVNADYATHTSSPINAECKIVQPEWNGDGLPPVGTDVEVFAKYSHLRFDRFIGQKVHIVAHDVINGDPVAVFRMPIDGDDTEQDYHAMFAGSFRPIRTPEQIIQEKREAERQAIRDVIKHALEMGGDPAIALQALGYRKFEIVDN